MRVPLTEVGRRGRLELSFALQDGRTVLRDSYCEVPFKITRVLHPDSSVVDLILMQCTAGLFGGDDVDCTIRVESGARVRITQQSATKVHPSQDRRAAVQRNHVIVEDGADLRMYLEPLIPFAESRLRQSTLLDVHGRGRLSYWEGFMTGRVGRGESWRFEELESETRLRIDDKLMYLDRFRLCPGNNSQSRWAMHSDNYLGTGLAVGGDARCTASKLHQSLGNAGVNALSEKAMIVRVVSPTGPDFQRARERFCEHAERAELLR